MGAIDEEFEATLIGLQQRFRARPERELEQLLLLALEREQLVTVAYRNDLMAHRLEQIPLDPELIRVFRHSLAWAWKDEQMHAIYTRGLLFRWGRPWVRVRAMAQQLAGSIGGWASSVTQHVRWSRAPVARLVAAVIAWAGRVGGKVPQAVRKELRYLTFEEFASSILEEARDRGTVLPLRDSQRSREVVSDLKVVPHQQAVKKKERLRPWRVVSVVVDS